MGPLGWFLLGAAAGGLAAWLLGVLLSRQDRHQAPYPPNLRSDRRPPRPDAPPGHRPPIVDED
jgi:hypothetical protein